MTLLRQGYGGLGSSSGSEDKPKIYFLVGTTASGKTDVSIELAKKFPIEIINADSLQVFRHLDIGTAKPSAQVQEKVTHHLIDILNPDEPFTAKEYKILAEEKALDVIKRGRIPLFVGGAGFYLKAISNPISDLPEGRSDIQDQPAAYRTLIEKDPALSDKIHPNDLYRISRALFLLEKGILPSRAFEVRNDSEKIFDIEWMGIAWERDDLRKRIEQRIKLMFEAGLLDETKQVLEKFPNARLRLERSIGYQECVRVLSKELSVAQAMEESTIHTHQYAKRQRTWFRKNFAIEWSSFDQAVEAFSHILTKSVE